MITEEMIARVLSSSTNGDENSVIADYISTPDRLDPDWSAIGGYPKGVHPSYACTDWQQHIIRRILEIGLAYPTPICAIGEDDAAQRNAIA